MFKIFYIIFIAFILFSCGKNDISELGISQDKIENDNKNFELTKNDKQRLLDISNIRAAIEQYYQDNGEYPNKENFNDTAQYFSKGKLPKDVYFSQKKGTCKFGYLYQVGDDLDYGYPNAFYKISSCLESEEYLSKNAETDLGNNDEMFEIGNFSTDTKFKETFYINDLNLVLEKSNTKEKNIVSEKVKEEVTETDLDFINKYYYELGSGNLEYVYSITSWEKGQKDYSTFYSWYNGIQNVTVDNIVDNGNGNYTITVTLFYEGINDGEKITTNKKVIYKGDKRVLQTIKSK